MTRGRIPAARFERGLLGVDNFLRLEVSGEGRGSSEFGIRSREGRGKCYLTPDGGAQAGRP